jgi:hypothetical protein
MVTPEHESLHRIFQKDRELFARAMAKVLGVPVPVPDQVTVLNSDLTEIRPVERRLDSVLLAEILVQTGASRYILVIESQTEQEETRRRRWPYAIAYLHDKYDRPVILLVVCSKTGTAQWAREPIRIGLPDVTCMTVQVIVFGPDNVPVVTDPVDAAKDVCFTVFSALTHSRSRQVGGILKALAQALGTVDVATGSMFAAHLVGRAPRQGSAVHRRRADAHLWYCHSVLGAIAAGNATSGGIANYVGRKSSEVTHPLTVLEDAGLITREADPFHARKSLYRISEPLITFYEAIMRPTWPQLERRQATTVWRRQRSAFLSQVVGPHFEALCREWATQAGEEVFAGVPAEVAGTAIPDPGNRTQIQVGVAVLSAGTPEEPRRVLSLGEAKWGEVMGLGHLDRLRRARDLLSVKKHRAADALLACYSGAGFTPELTATAAADPHVLLVDLNRLYEEQQ